MSEFLEGRRIEEFYFIIEPKSMFFRTTLEVMKTATFTFRLYLKVLFLVKRERDKEHDNSSS